MNLASRIAIAGMAGIAALTIACGTDLLPAHTHVPQQTVNLGSDLAVCPGANSYVQELFNLVNQYRIENNLPPLKELAKLTNAARWMTEDMATKNYFSHTDSLGRSPYARMDLFGYNYNTWRGENLGAGFSNAEAAFLGFKNSPEHKAAMLDPNYLVTGLAFSCNPDSQYWYYWAQEFGGTEDKPSFAK
ncbi:MAG: CAP domain-containing protein [Nanoarchaeota archaeon]|nr:MAG: CAP domain-containing protein [Nanoarchaeota archaeon]